jgi:hypothetical protein
MRYVAELDGFYEMHSVATLSVVFFMFCLVTPPAQTTGRENPPPPSLSEGVAYPNQGEHCVPVLNTQSAKGDLAMPEDIGAPCLPESPRSTPTYLQGYSLGTK